MSKKPQKPAKVCRVLTSVNLNQKKYDELDHQAKLLGKLRKEIWQRFGSLAGVGANHRKIRDEWVKTRDFSPLPAKAWKETLRKARGSCLRLVNCAYTSQVDSNTHRLEGRRVGDKFYHANGEVSHADTNAAANIKHRADNTEITRYTPYKEVKRILLARSAATGGVSEPARRNRPSLTPVARRKRTSTESELPQNLF